LRPTRFAAKTDALASFALLVCFICFSCLRARPAPPPDAPPPPATGATAPAPPMVPGTPAACWNPRASVPLTGVSCAPLRPPQVSCFLPADVEGDLAQTNDNARQRASDLFAWQTFLSLQWPAAAGERGVPDPRMPLDASGPRTWETMKETSEVYCPGGAEPPPWGEDPAPGTACFVANPCTGAAATRVLFRTAKVDDVLDDANQPTVTDGSLPKTLKDRWGRDVRFEIRMNRVLFEYVRANGLYRSQRQVAQRSFDLPEGSILVKAAWRELDGGDGVEQVAADACVCSRDKASGAASDCRQRRVGLVGFHVMQKTRSAPQWIWSTFEHADQERWLSRAACPGAGCNAQTPPGVPSSVERVTTIPSAAPDCNDARAAVDDVVRLDADVDRALARSGATLSRYRLVGAQWPVSRPSGAATVVDVLPAKLANTTLETFIQDTSSCMGCHAMARSSNPSCFASAGFTFTLNDAQPILANPSILPPPERSPPTSADAARWSDVLRGERLVTHTFEELPEQGAARLHCQSCHLDAGRNPTAAWYAATPSRFPPGVCLWNRINQCFQNSMNHAPLCSTARARGPGSCADNADMRAISAYIEWVSASYAARRSGVPPPAGFPAIPEKSGDAASGQRTFRQKCAFCHGADGQGRYGVSGQSYYRPALWGPSSFNIGAGMESTRTVAAFVRANMPFGSGGALTDDEAWDLAAFLKSQPRPPQQAPSPSATCAHHVPATPSPALCLAR